MAWLLQSYRRANYQKYRTAILTALIVLVLLSAYRFSEHVAPLLPVSSGSGSPLFTPVALNFTKDARSVRIAKASLLYGEHNYVYEDALRSHERHNKLHGYETHIMRRPITKGYWNKFLWLQQLIVEELGKPMEDRVDWIMYAHPSTIVLNPEIPLDMFLPPEDEILAPISFIATKPNSSLSLSSFFVRVAPSSLTVLTAAMATLLGDKERDWGTSIDEAVLHAVLHDEDFRDLAVYQPGYWYNHGASRNGYGIGDGDIMINFPSDLQGERWKMMDQLLNELSTQKSTGKYEKNLQDTRYVVETKEYWKKVARAKAVLYDAQSIMSGEGLEAFVEKVIQLKDCVQLFAWETEALENITNEVEGLMKAAGW